MFLDKIAQRGTHIPFSGFDADTEDFESESFFGRLGPTDRFLSIYNRPTRMRQLYVNPGTVLPESDVFKDPGTGAIYIIGAARSDSKWNVSDKDPYVTLVMAHECTPNGLGTAGRAEVKRFEVQGPPDDPGWAVNTHVGKFWVDMEYRTSKAEEGTYDLRVSNYYAWFSSGVRLKKWDTVHLDGQVYRVNDWYTDMGYMAASLDEEADPRVDAHVITQEGRTYNPDTHQYESTPKDYKVTVIIPDQKDIARWGGDSDSSIEVIIPHENIGFEPEPNMKVKFNDRERVIKSVQTQASMEQYKVICL